MQARKGSPHKAAASPPPAQRDAEIVRWYDGEDHELFDVCADDHCQRYHGLTKITSDNVRDAVRETRGIALTNGSEICDARYSKACGGLTEEFRTAWADVHVPYLVSIYDGPGAHDPIATEEQAERWIDARPDVYCNTKDEALLASILPDFDRETTSFFRWTVEYTRGEARGDHPREIGFGFRRPSENRAFGARPLGPDTQAYDLRLENGRCRG